MGIGLRENNVRCCRQHRESRPRWRLQMQQQISWAACLGSAAWWLLLFWGGMRAESFVLLGERFYGVSVESGGELVLIKRGGADSVSVFYGPGWWMGWAHVAVVRVRDAKEGECECLGEDDSFSLALYTLVLALCGDELITVDFS